MSDFLGTLVFEIFTLPAEWLADKLWRLHRKRPTWWRVVSATVLGLLTVLIYIAWLALLFGVAIAIVYLFTG